MFFLFSKLLTFMLSPFIWILVLLVFAFFSKKPNRRRNLLIISLVLMLLFSNGFILNEVVKKWEIHPVKYEKVTPHQYVIVLGGFSSYDTVYKKTKLNDAGDRIWQTLQLYFQKKANKIFISGGSGRLLHQDLTEADKAKSFLLTMNIPQEDIIIDQTSRNTHENALNTASWIKKNDPKATCILVTSATHMRRSLGCFKKAGLKVTPYSCDSKSNYSHFDLDEAFIPNVAVLLGWETLLKEISGYGIYKIAGFI